MNREGKYRIVLIEPSEIVAAGIGAIIDKNPELPDADIEQPRLL